MPIIEDVLKGNPVAAVGVGVAALAFPILFPSLRPQWAAVVKSGAKLFLEAEGGAEGDIIAKLADQAVDQLADDVAHDTPEQRHHATASTVSDFKALARKRSDRLGRTQGDREARYRRHLAGLRRAVERRQARSSGARKQHLGTVLDALGEDRAER